MDSAQCSACGKFKFCFLEFWGSFFFWVFLICRWWPMDMEGQLRFQNGHSLCCHNTDATLALYFLYATIYECLSWIRHVTRNISCFLSPTSRQVYFPTDSGSERWSALPESHTAQGGQSQQVCCSQSLALILSVHHIKLPLEKQSYQLLMTSLTLSLQYTDASRVSLNYSKSQNRALCRRRGGQGKTYRSLGNVFLSNC